MNKKSLDFILSRMTYYTRLISSRRCSNINTCYAIVDFCVSLLNVCGVYVAWQDTSNSWVVVSTND